MLRESDYYIQNVADCPHCGEDSSLQLENYWRMHCVACKVCGFKSDDALQPYDSLTFEQSKAFSKKVFQRWNDAVASEKGEIPVEIVIVDREDEE